MPPERFTVRLNDERAEWVADEAEQRDASKLLEEGPSDPDSTLPQIDDVTVGYGQDTAMFESWDTEVEWWTTVSPQEECTRFRIFCPSSTSQFRASSST